MIMLMLSLSAIVLCSGAHDPPLFSVTVLCATDSKCSSMLTYPVVPMPVRRPECPRSLQTEAGKYIAMANVLHIPGNILSGVLEAALVRTLPQQR